MKTLSIVFALGSFVVFFANCSAPEQPVDGDNAGSVQEALTSSVCASAVENANATLTCPAGQTITAITFASYGTPTGSCGSFAASSCSAANSATFVQSACLGKSTCTVGANNTNFGDPCSGADKLLDIQATCSTSGDAGADAGADAAKDAAADAKADAPADTGTNDARADTGSTDSGGTDSGGTDSGTSSTLVCATAVENATATATCPTGKTISSITFASYGAPTGTCGSYVATSCNASNSVSVVTTACLGKTTCSVGANNTNFGDPCSGTNKSLDFSVLCTGPGSSDAGTDAGHDAGTDAGHDAGVDSGVDAGHDAGAGDASFEAGSGQPGTKSVSLTDTNIFLTPENWLARTSSALETSNPGAYLKVGFTGTSISIVVDSSTQVYEQPKIGIQVDGGSTQYVTIGTYATAVTLPLATGLAAGTHQARISLEGLGIVDRWNVHTDRLKITNILIDSGASTVAPALRPKRMVAYGDSITEGASTLSNDDFVSTAQWSTTWDSVMSDSLNAEISAIAYQGQGYEQAGQGQVPGYLTAYNLIRSGVSRTFSSPDYVFIHHGSNGTVTQSDVATMLTRMRTSYPNAAIYLDVPFGGYNRAAITAAYQAQSNPKNYFIDLGSAGETTVATYSTDGAHPTPTGHSLLAQMMLPYVH